jgi:mono/diheme cytochrome c family protein
MLTQKFACPSCDATLKVADTVSPGKRIKCPKCGTAFPVPGGNGHASSAKVAAGRPRKPAPPPEEEDDLDEEVQERPVSRKRRKKQKKASGMLPLVIIGGVVLLVGVGVTLAIVFWPSGKKTEAVADNGAGKQFPMNPGGGMGAGMDARGRGAGGGMGGQDGRGGRGPADTGTGGGGGQQFAAGMKVYEANNCAKCHSIGGGGQGGGGRGFGSKKDLSHVGGAHTVDWLKGFIRNPKGYKPNVRMPAYDESKMSDADLSALAEYLGSLK